ncbi:cytochrome c-type biogenesis CcmF C-terminal domain-containing protein [Escherichia coli]
MLLIVLVGTLYPMIYGLLGWGRLSVGAPYFNRATLPFGLLMLVVIALATFVSGKRVQLPALVAHAGVLLFAAGIAVSSVSRQEISLNLQPGQQVTLAGYTFRFERLDLQARGNYTSEKAIVALFDHQQRIGELTPERRFYEARRQQMMNRQFAGTASMTGMRSWGRKLARIVTLFVCMYKAVCAGSRGGGLLMIAGALLSGWRGRKRDE